MSLYLDTEPVEKDQLHDSSSFVHRLYSIVVGGHVCTYARVCEREREKKGAEYRE